MPELNMEKLEELAGKVVGNANAALSGLLAYIGDQTGVYRAMADRHTAWAMERMGALTDDEKATVKAILGKLRGKSGAG